MRFSSDPLRSARASCRAVPPRVPALAAAVGALVAGRAWSHTAHDPVLAVAVSPDYATDGVLVGAFRNEDVGAWTISRDGGLTWVFQPDAATDEFPVDVAFGDARTLWALDEARRVWRSADAGATWSEVTPPSVDLGRPFHVAARGAFEAWIAADGGLRVTRDGGASWEGVALGSAAPRCVALVPGETGATRVLVGDREGGVWSGDADGSAFAAASAPPGAAVLDLAIAPGSPDDGRIWAGTEGAGLWASADGGDTFTAVDSLDPGDADEGHPGVVPAVLAAGGWLFAATADQAVYRSGDGGATFERFASGIEEVAYDTLGGVPDGDWGYTRLLALPSPTSPARLILASWSGLFASFDEGETWWQTPQVTEQYVRSAAFHPDWPADGTVWSVVYGGGVVRAQPDEEEFRVSNVGLEVTWMREIAVSAGDPGVRTVFAVHAIGGGLSHDDGETWERLHGLPFGNLRHFVPSPSFDHDGRVLALGGPEGETHGLAVSVDGGGSWQVARLEGFDGDAPAEAAAYSPDFEDDRTVYAVFNNRHGLARSVDGGDSFQRVSDAGFTQVDGLAVFPGPDAERVVVVASRDDGLHRSTDGGATFTPSAEGLPEGAEVLSIRRAGRDDLFVGTHRHGLFRSTDRGLTFASLAGFPACTMVLGAVAAPTWPEPPDLAVMTYEGAFWSRDGGETFELLSRHVRFEDHLPTWTWSEEWEAAPAEGGESGAGVRISRAAGATGWARVRGTELTVIVTTTAGSGSLRLVVDGVERASCCAASPETAWQVPLCHVGGLDPGWHDVVVEALSDDPVHVDALDARRGPEDVLDVFNCEPLATPGAVDLGWLPPVQHLPPVGALPACGVEEEPGCGCGAGGPRSVGGAAVPLLAAAAVGWRRRAVGGLVSWRT